MYAAYGVLCALMALCGALCVLLGVEFPPLACLLEISTYPSRGVSGWEDCFAFGRYGRAYGVRN